MVWISLAESAELASRLVNGLDQSPIAKSIHTVKQYCCLEWVTGNYKPLQFGTMCEHSEKTQGPFLDPSSMSFTAVSHARILALQEAEKAWKENEADWLSRSCAWPKKSSPRSYFWRTCQQLPREAVVPSLKKLPRWGMIVGGVLYPVQNFARRIREKGGSYLPTLTASQAGKPIRQPSPTRLNKKH